jgi:hypothetical protein
MRQAFVIVSLLTGLTIGCGGIAHEREGGEPDATSASSASAAADTPSAPEIPCVGHVLTWTGDGGWGGPFPSSSITGCRSYERTDGSARCASQLRTAGLWTLRDLTAAIEDPVVVAAFARGGAIGHLASPYDGVDVLLHLDGAKLLIGKEPPEPLVHLLEVLRDIDIAECPEED